jgi:hypothetical protein
VSSGVKGVPELTPKLATRLAMISLPWLRKKLMTLMLASLL